ncbi:MAG: tetratricopeptide repeat protein [Bacteroidales bacterium]
MNNIKRFSPGMIILILSLIVFSCSQKADQDTIPVTTSSEVALDLYNNAMSFMEDVYIDKANDALDQALKEDPGFFMANYAKATNSLYFNDMKAYKSYSEKAINTEENLSKGELLLKDVLVKLNEDPDADVTPILIELVELYPKDKVGYYQLAMFQGLAGKYEAANETYQKLLEVTDNPAPVYNMMGYNYMAMDEMEKAKEAFDKYIELAPDLPNPYDSKGDYFMAVKEYEKAYESFMKAVEIDNDFTISNEKALKAKQMNENLMIETEEVEQI